MPANVWRAATPDPDAASAAWSPNASYAPPIESEQLARQAADDGNLDSLPWNAEMDVHSQTMRR